jgi:hypothetical protein
MSKLSFKLPKYDSAIAKFVGEVKKGLEKTDPILNQIPTHSAVHNGHTRQVSEPKILDTPMQQYSANMIIDRKWFLKTDIEGFRDFLWNLYASFSSEMKKGLFELVSKTTEATGNIINTKGLNIWQSYVETLKQWEIQFDEDGNPLLDDLGIYNGRTHERIDVSPKTPEQIKELEQIIEAKKQEYYAQKRTRRLS